jgi:pentatricopeptide repeat protein
MTRDESQPLSDAAAKDSIWKLYGGPFLPDDMDSSWALLMRERIHRLFLRFVLRAGRQNEEIGRLEEALLIYQKGIEAEDLAEDLYQGLIRCYQKLGRNAEALSVYQRMRHTLSIILGTQPSADTEALIRSLTAR